MGVPLVWLCVLRDLPHHLKAYSYFLGFSSGSVGKESTCNAGVLGSVPGLGRSPGGGHGDPLQYFCLENPHEQRSLAGYSPWHRKELDTTEQLSTTQHVKKASFDPGLEDDNTS